MHKHSEEDNKKAKAKHSSGEDKGAQSSDSGLSDSGDVKELHARLAGKEKEAADYYDKYVRALAELENYKRHAAREKADLLKYGNENIIKDIIPCLDNLDRGIEHADKTRDAESLIEGLRMIQGQLLGCLEKHGVTKIECVGQDFDPNIHEAIQSVESDEHEGNKVVEEFQKGYLLNSRLLKAAKVSVCKPKEGK